MVVDRRLTGETAENIFLSLVNQRGVFATSFDTEGLDGIAFDPKNELFKVGRSPFFVQIKARGSASDAYNSRNFPGNGIRKIESFAQALGLPYDSLYFVVGFYKNDSVRTIKYFSIPFSSLETFRTKKGWYQFSVKRCEAAMQEEGSIFEL